MREFKDLLRQVMDEQGLKAVDVSKKTGIGSGAISMYLSGKRSPKRNVIAKFAQGLNVSEAWFLGFCETVKDDLLKTKAENAKKRASGERTTGTSGTVHLPPPFMEAQMLSIC